MKHISESLPPVPPKPEEAEEELEPCPLGICDGSGIVIEGEFDDIREKPCPHTIDEDGDDMDDDS